MSRIDAAAGPQPSPNPLAPRPVSRRTALVRVAALYGTIQLASFVVLWLVLSEYTFWGVWLRGALGPLAAFEAIPRFRYHSLPGNIAFSLWCLAVLLAPFAYVARPRRATLAVSVAGLVVWWIFGMGFSIRHM